MSKPPDVTLRQLRAFIALARARNFTRAAALFHLSQPAFSELIRQFELTLGIRLFERSTRHVALTAQGQEFERSAQRLLAELDQALADMRGFASREHGHVSIALLPSLAAHWLPGILAGFRSTHPKVDVAVAAQLSEACLERLRSGRADFVLATTRIDSPGLLAEPLCSDDFHLVCPATHPLAKMQDPGPGDLAPWPFIHMARGSSVRQTVDAATPPGALQAVVEADHLATVFGMVRAGMGVSILPTLALQQHEAADLVARPLRWPGLTRCIQAIRRQDGSLSAAAQGLYRLMLARRPTGVRLQAVADGARGAHEPLRLVCS